MEMFSYAGELTEQKRRHPAEDIWAKIVQAEFEQPDGSKTSLSDFEMQVFFRVLATASSETTRNATSAGGAQDRSAGDGRSSAGGQPDSETGHFFIDPLYNKNILGYAA